MFLLQKHKNKICFTKYPFQTTPYSNFVVCLVRKIPQQFDDYNMGLQPGKVTLFYMRSYNISVLLLKVVYGMIAFILLIKSFFVIGNDYANPR